MAPTLWHGTLTAQRYTLDCPYCHTSARVDTDALGRTLVICPCRGSLTTLRNGELFTIHKTEDRFPMPLVRGGLGIRWVVDLSPAAVSTIDPTPRAPRPAESRTYAGRAVKGKPCATPGCRWVRGPKAKYCGRCSKAAQALVYQCTTKGCTNVRKRRAKRCEECRYHMSRNRLAQLIAERHARGARRTVAA